MTATLSLIDTHAHLDFDAFESDFDGVLGRARDAGVHTIIAIGASRGVASNDAALALAESYSHIWATQGVHPHEAQHATDPWMRAITSRASDHDRVVAVGETGLDYHYDYSPRNTQQEVFARLVEVACEVKCPLVIHSREADEDTIAILREGRAERVGGVIHCFSGTAWLAEQALDLGFYLSFSGILTFKWAKHVQEVARTAPSDRIMVETDAPFLAPGRQRGKRNEPAFVAHTLRFLAELRGEEPASVAEATTANAQRLFGLRSFP